MLFSIKIRHNKITREAFQGHVQVGISLEQSRPESWNVLWSSSTDLSALEIFSWILLSLLKGFFLCVCVCWEKHWTGMTESKQCMIKEKSRLEMGLRNQTWPLFSIDDFCRYQPPNLAISTLYWKAWPLLLVVAAFNPENIGECGHFSGYQVCCKKIGQDALCRSLFACVQGLGWVGEVTAVQ